MDVLLGEWVQKGIKHQEVELLQQRKKREFWQYRERLCPVFWTWHLKGKENE